MTGWKLRLAKKIIDRGGIIAYPTESVFGLGCDPLNYHAVETICQLKNRSLSKGLILIASHIDQLESFTLLAPAQRKKLHTQRSKPTTWIVPASKDCPPWLRGQYEGIAVRLTRHPLARQLCEHMGHALISTSANISQHPAARNALTVQRIFGQKLDLILHADTGQFSQPSEIIDIRSNKLIRRG
jgi:L-threonylcarbamoyladenylate synthase